MRPLAALLFALAAPVATSAAEPEHPFKNAKVGDTMTLKLTVKSAAVNLDGTMTQTVTEKNDQEVTLKTVTNMFGKDQPAQTTKIDLATEFDPTSVVRAMKGAKAEKLKDGTEKVKVGDKEYDCAWTTYKVDPGANAPKGMGGEMELKVWVCKDVPGPVKITTTTKVADMGAGMTIEMIKFETKK